MLIAYFSVQAERKSQYLDWTFDVKLYQMNRQAVNLDWPTVVSLYEVNPERWSINKKLIVYKTDDDYEYIILLSFEDYWSYISWLSNREKQEKDNQEKEAIKNILKCGQRDIERLRERIEENLKKAKDTTNEIKERLKEKIK